MIKISNFTIIEFKLKANVTCLKIFWFNIYDNFIKDFIQYLWKTYLVAISFHSRPRHFLIKFLVPETKPTCVLLPSLCAQTKLGTYNSLNIQKWGRRRGRKRIYLFECKGDFRILLRISKHCMEFLDVPPEFLGVSRAE